MKNQHRILTVGEITLDDIVVEDQGVHWKQAGGGALYSAIGASLWSESGICSTVGHDYPQNLLDEIETYGINTAAINRTSECGSLGLWLLYENSGERHQFEKSSGGTFQQLDSLRPKIAHLPYQPTGVHLAPQSSEGHFSGLQEMESTNTLVTLDLLVESYIKTSVYLQPEFLRRANFFLPSSTEVLSLWGHENAGLLESQLRSLGFEGTVVIKRGANGVDVATPNKVVNVPAVPVNIVDVTGAGDAFCGGFIAGLLADGNPFVAAAYGVVSASFVVETRGAITALKVLDKKIAASRLELVLSSIRGNI